MPNIHKTDAQWREELTEEQYRVLRGKATEPPFSGNLQIDDQTGIFTCVACSQVLFKTNAQYDSTQLGLQGWPSFAEVAESQAVTLIADYSFGMNRVEVSCANCGSHLGHVFDDESSPSGKHYCVNAISLDFQKQTADDKETT